MFTKEQILRALTRVIHPEKGKDIVTLGLVSEIETGEEGIVVTITPEKSNDPFISSVKSSVARTLKEVLGTDAVIKEIIVKPRIKVPGQQVIENKILPGVKNIKIAPCLNLI